MQSLESLSSNQLMLVLNRCDVPDTTTLLSTFTEKEIQYVIDLIEAEAFKSSRRPDYENFGDYEW